MHKLQTIVHKHKWTSFIFIIHWSKKEKFKEEETHGIYIRLDMNHFTWTKVSCLYMAIS